MLSRSIKYAIYIVELEAIKENARAGVLLSRLQLITEATSPVRSKKEEQEANHTYPLWTVSYSSAVHCLYIQRLKYRQRLISCLKDYLD
jgi:hypothetical protein